MDFSELPLTNQDAAPPQENSSCWWQGVTWHKAMFARATGPTLGLFGMDRDYMTSHQAGFFMLQAHLKCLFPLAASQRVDVYSRLIDRTEKRFHFMHLMVIRDRSELAATCEVVGAHIDLTERRMAPLPPTLAQRFDELLSGHKRLQWQPPVCGAMRP